MSGNTESPYGYDHEFVEEVPQDYICSICHLAMRKPVQTKCGHRFCKGCLDNALKRQSRCPLDNKPLTSQQIFEDVATERKILSLKIKCSKQGCDWQGEIRKVQTHDEECMLTTVPCFYVTIGCKFKAPRRSLDDHYKNSLPEHLAITTQKLLTLQDENHNLKKQVSSITLMTKDDQSHYSYVWRINDFSKQPQLAEQQDQDIILHSEPFYTFKFGYKLKLALVPNGFGEDKGTHLTVGMTIMRGEYDAILTWPFDWKYKFTLLDQRPDHSKCKNIDNGYNSPDITTVNYQRPTADENIGIEYTKFVSHQTLETEKYVIGGVVFIKFELENPSPQN